MAATPFVFAQTLDKLQIETLLPHAGDMCLLDQVCRWDENSIACSAHTHRRPNHPLRRGNRLPITAGIEYCAQAMALHARLTKGAGLNQATTKAAYLTVLSDVQWQREWLDDCQSALAIYVECKNRTLQAASYEFTLTHEQTQLMTGTALVAYPQQARP